MKGFGSIINSIKKGAQASAYNKPTTPSRSGYNKPNVNAGRSAYNRTPVTRASSYNRAR